MQQDNTARTHNDSLIEDSQSGLYLTFRLEREAYGLDIRYVTEIIGVQKITSVPDLPATIKGVINLRGKVIPIMDVRLRFGIEEREYDAQTCIIVVRVKDQCVGLVVDRVNEVMPIDREKTTPPAQIGSHLADYIQGIGKVGEDVKIILDVEALLGLEELAAENF